VIVKEKHGGGNNLVAVLFVSSLSKKSQHLENKTVEADASTACSPKSAHTPFLRFAFIKPTRLAAAV
jgi:hypothetical protein